MYKNKKWLDDVKDNDTGEIIQEGTPMSAGNFNNMENGITDAHVATALTMINVRLNTERCDSIWAYLEDHVL